MSTIQPISGKRKRDKDPPSSLEADRDNAAQAPAESSAPAKSKPPRKKTKRVEDTTTSNGLEDVASAVDLSVAPSASGPSPNAAGAYVEGTVDMDLRKQVAAALKEIQDDGPSKRTKDVSSTTKNAALKRPFIPGRIRKLAPAKPRAPSTTLSGHRLAALPSARISANVDTPPATLEMWVSRRTGFSHYLKKGLEVFRKGRGTRLRIRAMGAAITMALSIAMAVNEGIGGGLQREVRTLTEEVTDEIEPGDDDADMQYQQRRQSAIEIVLRAPPPLAQRLERTPGSAPAQVSARPVGRASRVAAGRPRVARARPQ